MDDQSRGDFVELLQRMQLESQGELIRATTILDAKRLATMIGTIVTVMHGVALAAQNNAKEIAMQKEMSQTLAKEFEIKIHEANSNESRLRDAAIDANIRQNRYTYDNILGVQRERISSLEASTSKLTSRIEQLEAQIEAHEAAIEQRATSQAMHIAIDTAIAPLATHTKDLSTAVVASTTRHCSTETSIQHLHTLIDIDTNQCSQLAASDKAARADALLKTPAFMRLHDKLEEFRRLGESAASKASASTLDAENAKSMLITRVDKIEASVQVLTHDTRQRTTRLDDAMNMMSARVDKIAARPEWIPTEPAPPGLPKEAVDKLLHVQKKEITAHVDQVTAQLKDTCDTLIQASDAKAEREEVVAQFDGIRREMETFAALLADLATVLRAKAATPSDSIDLGGTGDDLRQPIARRRKARAKGYNIGHPATLARCLSCQRPAGSLVDPMLHRLKFSEFPPAPVLHPTSPTTLGYASTAIEVNPSPSAALAESPNKAIVRQKQSETVRGSSREALANRSGIATGSDGKQYSGVL